MKKVVWLLLVLLIASFTLNTDKIKAGTDSGKKTAPVNNSVAKKKYNNINYTNTKMKRLFFVEYGVNYSAAVSPGEFSDSSVGVYNTAGFNAKAGMSVNIIDFYAGLSFLFFADRQNVSQHYTFIPVVGGVRINILKEMIVYPDIFFEYGRSISNRHIEGIDSSTMQMIESDYFWTDSYYNYGLGINWNFTDISVLSLRVERPAIKGRKDGEYHIFQAGVFWKLAY